MRFSTHEWRSMKHLIAKTLFAAAAVTAGIAQAGNVLPANTPLGPGQSLVSGNGKYMLVQQASDGNLVVYRKADMKAIWSLPKLAGPNAWAVVQSDLNFVVYTGPYPTMGSAVWSSGTGQSVNDPTAKLTLGEDGSLALSRSSSTSPYWTTLGDFDSPICADGSAKQVYAICPLTTPRYTSYIFACSYSQAQAIAARSGATYGACYP
jgi:hypothetical protein